MGKYYIQAIIIFLLLFANAKRKSCWFTPSSFLIAIYLISAILAIPTISIEGFTEPQKNEMWIPMLSFVSLLLLFLIPFTRFNETSIKEIVLPNRRILDIFSTFIIALSIFSIIFFSSSVRMVFSLSSLVDARNALYEGEKYFEVGLANTIASVGASMYVFAILLYFIYTIIGGCKKRCALLLFSSISEPLHILSYVGRDGIVFWLFSFVFLFLFFRPFLQVKNRKKISRFFVIIALVLMIPFLAISTSRFGETESGTERASISYMGQSMVNGSLFMNIENKPLSHGADFPLFFELIGNKRGPREIGGGMIRIGEWRSWGFSTFVISLYTDFGLWGLITLAIACIIIQYCTLGRRKIVFQFQYFFIYILFFQIYSQGVFYFKQYTRGGNLFILLCFALFFLFKCTKNSKRISSIA